MELNVVHSRQTLMEIDHLGEYQVYLVMDFDQALIDSMLALDRKAFGADSAINVWGLVPLIRHGRVFVLTHPQQEIVGSAMVMRDWNLTQSAYLYSYAIAPEAQGQGLGYKFLNAVLNFLRKQKTQTITLTVQPDHQAAVSLYQKLGFQVRALHPDEYGRGVARYIMELNLQ